MRGRRVRLLLSVALLGGIILGCTLTRGAPEIPPGVDESHWKPLAPGLGLVLEQPESGKMSGHLMAKSGDKWMVLRLHDPDAGAVVPAK